MGMKPGNRNPKHPQACRRQSSFMHMVLVSPRQNPRAPCKLPGDGKGLGLIGFRVGIQLGASDSDLLQMQPCRCRLNLKKNPNPS